MSEPLAHGNPGGQGNQMPAVDGGGIGDAAAPYYAGPVDPIDSAGDHDADDADTVRGDPAAAVQAADARWQAQQQDASHAGGRIGDTLIMPASPLDPGVGSTGTTDPAGSFYDPPRQYSSDPNGSGAPVQEYPAK